MWLVVGSSCAVAVVGFYSAGLLSLLLVLCVVFFYVCVLCSVVCDVLHFLLLSLCLVLFCVVWFYVFLCCRVVFCVTLRFGVPCFSDCLLCVVVWIVWCVCCCWWCCC